MPRKPIGRNPLSWECPKCGAAPGHKCRSYTGRPCGPHRARINWTPPKPPPPPPTAPAKRFSQTELFMEDAKKRVEQFAGLMEGRDMFVPRLPREG